MHGSFCPNERFIHAGIRALDVAALAVHDGAVGVVVFNVMMVEDLTKFFSCSYLTSAHAHSFHGVCTLEPVHDIDIVDMLFDDMIAAEPRAILRLPHLVFHLGVAGPASVHPHTITVPVNLRGSDVAHHSTRYPLQQFPVRTLVVALQPDHH